MNGPGLVGGGERGAVGGIEVLPFSMLVVVGGMLLFASAWAVVDAKLAVEQAATAAGRAHTAAGDPATAADRALAAAGESFRGTGRDPAALVLRADPPTSERCAVVEHEATTVVQVGRLPFVGSFGPPVTVRGRHRTIVDRFGSGLSGEADCG